MRIIKGQRKLFQKEELLRAKFFKHDQMYIFFFFCKWGIDFEADDESQEYANEELNTLMKAYVEIENTVIRVPRRN